MFDTLTKGFDGAINHFRGRSVINKENLSVALEQIRKSLLEADVALEVTDALLSRVSEKALKAQLRFKKKGRSHKAQSISEFFTTICYEEIRSVLGSKPYDLKLKKPYATILMVGLQGVGKTTSCGKLAKYLLNLGKKPLLVAGDIYRPAAIEQLKVLGEAMNVPVFTKENTPPVTLSLEALEEARRLRCDVIIFDTAGRQTLDTEMMKEVEDIATQISPDHTFLVVDSMMGQDALNTAKSFQQSVNMDAVVMTKLDGDARGGAALSATHITGKPIAFIGTGEHEKDFELFRPDGLSSRILGMGDISGLVEEYRQELEEFDELSEDFDSVVNSDKFNFDLMLRQFKILKKLGGLKRLATKLPRSMAEIFNNQLTEHQLKQSMAAIESMTLQERKGKVAFSSSRIKRIAQGSGTSDVLVQNLTQRFMTMRQMALQKSYLASAAAERMGFNPELLEAHSSDNTNSGAERRKEQALIQKQRKARKAVRAKRKTSQRSRRKR